MENPNNQLDLRDVALFLEVARRENVSAGGRVFGLSPASASQRIQNLERQLGARLLHRTTRRVALSEDGRIFFGHAERIVEDVANAREALSGAAQELRGTLRITTPASFGRQHIAPFVAAFLEQHPQLQIKLDMSDATVDLVEQGLDVAIRIGKLQDSSLAARKIARNRRIICASPDYLQRHGIPQHPHDLSQHNVLILGEKRRWSFDTPKGIVSVGVTGNFEANNGEALKCAAVAGLGITMKSIWDIAAHLTSGRLVPILTAFPLADEVAIWGVYPTTRLIPARARAFVDHLISCFGRPHPYWEAGLEELCDGSPEHHSI